MMLAAFLFLIRWFMYGFWDHPNVLTYLQLLQGVTFPIFFVAVFHYVTKLIPKNLIATGQLLFMAATMGICGLIGNAVGGWHMENYSPQATYYIAGWISLVAAVLLTFTIVMSRRRSVNNEKQAMY
jgi:MFS family permease